MDTITRVKGYQPPQHPYFPLDICFLQPDCTTLTDVRTENTDVREAGFHPPR